jgi:hypothetical protein
MVDDGLYDPYFIWAHRYAPMPPAPAMDAACGDGAAPAEGGAAAGDAGAAADAGGGAAADGAAEDDGGTQAYAPGTGAGAAGAGADGGATGARRWPLARPLYPLLRYYGAHVSRSCVTESSFNDADNDGVPVGYTATFACTNQKNEDNTVTIVGQATVNDGNDASNSSGYTVTYKDFNIKTTFPDGSSSARTLNGTVNLVQQASNYLITRDLQVAFNFVPPETTDTAPITGTFVTKSTATYTPASAATPFAQGTLNPSGQATLSVFIEGGSVSRTITRASDPIIHWNRSCETATRPVVPFDSGAALYRDNAGATLRREFTGCGETSVKFTGAQ